MIQSESLQDTIENVGKKVATAIDQIPDHLEEDYWSWIELHGLDGQDQNAAEVVGYQSAFNILLKSALYRQYAQSQDLQELIPSEYIASIDQIAAQTGDEAFVPSFLDQITYAIPAADIKKIYVQSERLLKHDSPSEYIGRLYEQVLSNASRRPLGQFRTPVNTAELMAEWAVTEPDDTILDPGVGAGILTACAHREKQNLSGENSAPESDLVGIDKSPLSTLMAKVALTLEVDTGVPELFVADFLEEDLTRSFDAVICNPPYTRHHELDKEYKYTINQRLDDQLDYSISKLSPLHLYFYIRAAQYVKDGGRLSFITSAEFLETDYGTELREFLLDQFHVRAFILYNRSESIFENADTTSCITFLEKKANDESNDKNLTKFIRVDTPPENETLLETIENGKEGKTDWGLVNTVRQRDLEPENDWDSMFDAIDIGTLDELVPLSEIASVDRGIATGKNKYFCISESERTGEAAGFEWEINQKYLSPIIRKASKAPHYTYTEQDWETQRDADEEVWLLYHLDKIDITTQQNTRSLAGYTEDGVDEDEKKLAEYLKYGESEDVQAHESYLASNRNPWYVVDRRQPPDIFYTYMSKQKRFILNEANARALNNMLYIYLDSELNNRETKALLAYLNSNFADLIIRRSGRTYSTGLTKVEPGELEEIPVIDPGELDDSVLKDLEAQFDNLCAASRDPDRSESEVRDVISDILSAHLSL